MTPLTFTLLKGDEGRDRRCFDNGEGLYLPSSIPGPQEVNAELVFQPALLDVRRQPAHPHGPAARCHLPGERARLLWAGRLSTQLRFGYNQQKTPPSETLGLIVRPREFTYNKKRKLRFFSNNNLFQRKRILAPICSRFVIFVAVFHQKSLLLCAHCSYHTQKHMI